jgi:CDP-diacylglycerol pyrophosphatase
MQAMQATQARFQTKSSFMAFARKSPSNESIACIACVACVTRSSGDLTMPSKNAQLLDCVTCGSSAEALQHHGGAEP